MSRPTVLPCPELLRVVCLESEADGVTVVARPASSVAPCPACGAVAWRVHSRYARSAADLPWSGVPVRLRLHVRRFFCDVGTCARRIFAERLPGVVAPGARRTERLTGWLTHVAFALGGAPGARLLRALGVAVCGDTLRARIRAAPLAVAPAPRALSVDDFALRRGRTYGTLLVDLDRRRVVGLLPDRNAGTFAAWLRERPQPQVIARDRGGDYAEGARRGAPDAVQVADRFHLLKNVGAVAERVLRRHAPLVRRVPAPGGRGALRPPPSPVPRRDGREASRERTQAELRARYEAVQAAVAQGMNTMAAARALGLHRHTARTYRALPAAPERRHAWRAPSQLTPYEGDLVEQWRRGRRQAMALWRELVARGYPGAYRGVARFVADLRRRDRAGEPLVLLPPGLPPGQAAALLLVRPERQTPATRRAVAQLRALHPEVRATAALVEGVVGLLRGGRAELPGLGPRRWEGAAVRAGLPEFAAFVAKLRKDAAAVRAALLLPYSQGQIEGQITRVKLLKRAMYGRAKLDLLRRRVLYAAS